VHSVLLLATLYTTTLAGAVLAGEIQPYFSLMFNPARWSIDFFRSLATGLSFSIPLVTILLCHELGHYLTARRYQLNVSPPFFLPGLPTPYGIGTFGAFIRLRTIPSDRRQLLDVGAAGPIAGFVVTVGVLWYGLAHSQVFESSSNAMTIEAFGTNFGSSPLILLLRHITNTAHGEVILHPTAVAGWFGVYVTLLNLLPIAQLDGGHILYGAFPRVQRNAGRACWVMIVILGYFSQSWLFWAFVVLVLSRGQFGHPPVLDAHRPLPKTRIWLFVASVLLFVLTFMPIPFYKRP